MRIAVVSKFYPPVTGGVEHHARMEAELLAERGHSVRVVTLKTSLATSSGEENGVRVDRLAKGRILKYISSAKGSIVAIHGYRDLFIARMIRASPRPKVIRTHGIYPAYSLLDRIKKASFDRLIGVRFLNAADAITALTPYQVRQLRKLGVQNRITIIPNAIDVDGWERKLRSSSESFVDTYSIDSDNFAISVGRVDWNKGIEKVIAALPGILEQGYDFKYVVIGEDVDGRIRMLRKLAEREGVDKHVAFVGRVPFRLLLAALKEADALILPAFYEGLPTVVMEAMVAGCPVIATPNGGTRYLVIHRKTGYVCAYEDATTIAECVSELLNDATTRSMVVTRARELVKRKYSWKKVIVDLERFYSDVASTHGLRDKGIRRVHEGKDVATLGRNHTL